MYEHKFYKTSHLKKSQIFELINFSKENCINYKTDILDCSISCTRMPIDIELDKLIKLFKKNKTNYFTICERDYPVINDDDFSDYRISGKYLEIAISNLSSPSYHLWLKLDMKFKDEIVKKYNLEYMLNYEEIYGK